MDDFVISNFNAGDFVTFPLFIFGRRSAELYNGLIATILRSHRAGDGVHDLAAAPGRAHGRDAAG